MLDLLRAVGALPAARPASAEARHVHTREESLAVRDDEVDDVEAGESEGLGIRVLGGGAGGSAAPRAASRPGAEDALRRAPAVADAQPAAGERPLAPVAPQSGHWAG